MRTKCDFCGQSYRKCGFVVAITGADFDDRFRRCGMPVSKGSARCKDHHGLRCACGAPAVRECGKNISGGGYMLCHEPVCAGCKHGTHKNRAKTSKSVKN